MSSLLRRVSRYVPSHSLDPRENRLTEIFAGVLDEIPGLAIELASDWSGFRGSANTSRIRTQRAIPNGGFVDLEISIGLAALPSARIWVEAKNGTRPQADQLFRYMADLEKEPAGRRRLVLLIPRSVVAPEAPSDTQPLWAVDTWDRLAVRVNRWRRRESRHGTLTGPHEWLINQFLLYLKEEGLAEQGSLTSLHTVALAHAGAAERLLDLLRDEVEAIVSREWGPSTFAWKPRGAPRMFGNHHGAVPWLNPSLDLDLGPWFEWGLYEDSWLEEPRGSPVFGAGITFGPKPQGLAAWNESALWRLKAEPSGFASLAHGGVRRLYRHQYPEALLSADTLEAQAALLSAWVLQAFRDLTAQVTAA